jgi:hypothetical protein
MIIMVSDILSADAVCALAKRMRGACQRDFRGFPRFFAREGGRRRAFPAIRAGSGRQILPMGAVCLTAF